MKTENITVSVRFRPMNERELNKNAKTSWDKDGKLDTSMAFSYDHVFNGDDGTSHVYNQVAKPIVQQFLAGINGTIFAYGQTSSGKTYTMQGDGTVKGCGILQNSVTELFECIKQNQKLREDRDRGIYVESCDLLVLNASDVLSLLSRGERNRHVASTAMNDTSSRSHTIFKMSLESQELEINSETGDSLSLVDLAGSENAKNTRASGTRLREGGNINKSLLSLSRLTNFILERYFFTKHPSFRDSKLTWILKPSLAGNCRTALIACATLADQFVEETQSTLKFASRAKNIKTSVAVNMYFAKLANGCDENENVVNTKKSEIPKVKRSVSFDVNFENDNCKTPTQKKTPVSRFFSVHAALTPSADTPRKAALKQALVNMYVFIMNFNANVLFPFFFYC
eukprot:GSMAST32.ASY1.ANO1.2820.1 assembled CDS